MPLIMATVYVGKHHSVWSILVHDASANSAIHIQDLSNSASIVYYVVRSFKAVDKHTGQGSPS